MSQLLQLPARGDGITISDGVTTPVKFNGGFPYDGTALAVDTASAIDHYHQGLPFTSSGRLCVVLDGVVARVAPGGCPYNATGRVCLSSSPVAHYSAGIPYSAVQQVAIN